MFKSKFVTIGLLVLTIFLSLSLYTYAAKLKAEELEVTFTSGDFTLHGTLSLPERAQGEKLPVMVLVHGSGPVDRDETIPTGGIVLRPFKEIADGLKKQGFAVLRYDKRVVTMLVNGVSQAEVAKLMPEIFIEDAKAAIEYVKTLPEINPDRVFLVGHSEGAGNAPRIAAGQKLAGVVMLAPQMLPIQDQVIYQLEYQIKYLKALNTNNQLTPTITQIEDLLKQSEEAFARLNSGKMGKDEFIMGATAEYWIRWNELTINVPKQIAEMPGPALLIQGTADLKCPAELLKPNEAFLKGKKDLEIVYINNMIHELYRSGTAVFEKAVVDNIVKWAKSLL